MKKNVLSLSIAAAVAGFGLVGGAHAMTSLGGYGSGNLAINANGVGHQLIVPYFTAQAENATLINLVNTDLVNAKAVKVRFRGAANSDDVLDFQVFLSPGDVWAASVTKDSDGVAVLKTKDNSCLRPDKAAGAGAETVFRFSTARLDPSLTGDALAAGTREGYVEIFNMADIPPKAAWPAGSVAAALSTGLIDSAGIAAVAPASSTANPLFTAIKHVAKVAPCGAALTALDTIDPSYEATGAVGTAMVATTGSRPVGFLPPTTGLMANWTIINVVGAAAWSGPATALQTANTGNVVYFPQTGTLTGDAVTGTINNYTADPLLHKLAFQLRADGTLAQLSAAAIAANQNDLPDMSTPYDRAVVVSNNDPRAQALFTTGLLASAASSNEYLTDSTISASTDWVFSMPTRRYSTALNYSKIGATLTGTTDTGVRFSNLNPIVGTVAGAGAAAIAGDLETTVGASNDGYASTASYATAPLANTGYFNKLNSSTVLTTANGGRQICVNGITYSATDREESAKTTGAALSPVTAGPALLFCGEDSVLSVNLGSTAAPTRALKATVTQKDIDLGVGYVDGWMTLKTPGNSRNASAATPTFFGLPVLGGAFFKATNGSNSFGTFSLFRR